MAGVLGVLVDVAGEDVLVAGSGHDVSVSHQQQTARAIPEGMTGELWAECSGQAVVLTSAAAINARASWRA